MWGWWWGGGGNGGGSGSSGGGGGGGGGSSSSSGDGSSSSSSRSSKSSSSKTLFSLNFRDINQMLKRVAVFDPFSFRKGSGSCIDTSSHPISPSEFESVAASSPNVVRTSFQHTLPHTDMNTV